MSPAAVKADIVVIGAGSGGLSVAAGAAQLGMKVVLFERGEMGGDCLNTGCVPSKALLAAARAAHGMREAGRFGIAPEVPKIDWPAVRRHVKGVIETIAPIDSQERFEGFGVQVVREHARFVGPRTVESESVRVTARRIVIATGGSAIVPPIPGLAETPYLTNETVFDVPEFPRRLVVIGAGAIGVELGQAFRRLGADVTLIEAADPLGRMDRDAADVVVDRLRAEGVRVLGRTKATRVERTAAGVAVHVEGAAPVEGTHLLLALGRRPVTDGLDLEKGNVAYTAKGVTTDPWLRSATNPRVYAVGDVAGREQLTHAAGWHASAFVRTVLFKARTRADATPLAAVVYADPECAQIGLTEAEAIAQYGAKAKAVRWNFHENDRAQTERAPEGFAKLVVGPGGSLLGAAIVGEGAGEAIQIVAVAMANKLGVRALTNFVSPYPTRGEIVKRAAGAYYTPLLFSGRTRLLVRLLSRLPW
ncbi:MAG: FAD-dependent oxidoreductase [Alphaproteobacteria bacterium]|nr:FAD-dependent oxidoreductase [Alphaproteobacteria bacterium]